MAHTIETSLSDKNRDQEKEREGAIRGKAESMSAQEKDSTFLFLYH